MKADGAPFTPIPMSVLRFTAFLSYCYTDERKVETDVEVTENRTWDLLLRKPRTNQLSHSSSNSLWKTAMFPHSNDLVALSSSLLCLPYQQRRLEAKTKTANVPTLCLSQFFFRWPSLFSIHRIRFYFWLERLLQGRVSSSQYFHVFVHCTDNLFTVLVANKQCALIPSH